MPKKFAVSIVPRAAVELDDALTYISQYNQLAALKLAREHPAVLTAEYRKIKRPKGRVVVDYNQNAWGRTLASVYSVRPTPLATVSTPLEWRELEAGAKLEDFRLGNVPERVRARGDLWAPLAPGAPGRFDLARLDPGAIT